MLKILEFLKQNSLVVIIIVIAFFGGIFFSNNILNDDFTLTNKDGNDCLSDFVFINPEPGCELFENKIEKMSRLQSELQLQVDGYIQTKRADRISIFTRDLKTQRFAGINEGDVFLWQVC